MIGVSCKEKKKRGCFILLHLINLKNAFETKFIDKFISTTFHNHDEDVGRPSSFVQSTDV